MVSFTVQGSLCQGPSSSVDITAAGILNVCLYQESPSSSHDEVTRHN